MNDGRFDALTQVVAKAVSRRNALRLLAGGIASGMLGLAHNGAGPALAQGGIAELAEAMRAWEISEQNVEAAIAALAQAGIPVFEDPADTTPILEVAGTPSPVHLLRVQVHSLVLELSARNGFRGRAIDALVTLQEGIPPPSYLLAGYVATAPTPGGELARALMGNRNWKNAPDLIFPQVVFLLFASDLALDASGQAERRMAPPSLRSASLAQAGICSQIQQFVDDTISAVFDALKIAAPDNVPGQVLTGTWNWLVELGEDAVGTALETLLQPVIQTIRTIAGALAVGGMVVSLVQSWTVRVDPTPTKTRFGVGSEAIQGEFRARVDTGLLREWPPHVVDCAATVGVQMPRLNAGGSPVRWTRSEYPIDLIQDPPLPDKLDANGASKIDYVTNNESEAFAKGGEEKQGTLTLEARVKRQDLEKLQNALVDLLLAHVPAPFNQLVASLLGPRIKQLTNQLFKLKTGYGRGDVAVIYHEAPCIVGSWEIDNDAFLSALRAEGESPETSYDSVSGQATITFGIDGAVTMVAGAFTVDGTVTSDACSADVQVFMNGAWNTSYTDDGSSLAFDSGSGDLTYTTSVNACGVTSSTPTSATEVYASIPISYTCEGDTFQYTIPPYFTAPVVLRRIRASDQPPLDGEDDASEEAENDGNGAGTCAPETTDALDDKVRTSEETPVEVEVLANDCGEGIEISDVSTPIHGSATINPDDNTITYTPADRFTGTDGFTYEITGDDGETDTATVTVIVATAVEYDVTPCLPREVDRLGQVFPEPRHGARQDVGAVGGVAGAEEVVVALGVADELDVDAGSPRRDAASAPLGRGDSAALTRC